MFNAGVDDMEGLIAALPNATAILAHADKYNPRFKDGLAGSEDSVWLKGPKSATKGSSKRAASNGPQPAPFE